MHLREAKQNSMYQPHTTRPVEISENPSWAPDRNSALAYLRRPLKLSFKGNLKKLDKKCSSDKNKASFNGVQDGCTLVLV